MTTKSLLLKSLGTLLLVLSVMFSWSLSLTPRTAAHASVAASCPASSFPSTTGVGHGSTPAQVSVTIWENFNGLYASANSLRQSDGTDFTGTVSFTVTDSAGHATIVTQDSVAGIRDTPDIS